MALVRQLHGVKYQLAVGGGEDVAHRLHVQHAPCPPKARLGGLVAGAAVGDDGHPVGVLQVAADDQVAVHLHDVRIGQTQSHQLLVGDGLGGIDEFFHFHSDTTSHFNFSSIQVRAVPVPGETGGGDCAGIRCAMVCWP